MLLVAVVADSIFMPMALDLVVQVVAVMVVDGMVQHLLQPLLALQTQAVVVVVLVHETEKVLK
jgi:hypothetical protein